jgi:hypothetical protein
MAYLFNIVDVEEGDTHIREQKISKIYKWVTKSK